jgi:hypothetical protein
MERINASGTRRLLFPTFLSIFWTTICDLREFLIEHDTPARRIWCADVLAELRAVVNDKVAKSSELLDGIMLHIQPALESLPSEILSMGWYRDPAIPLTTRYISDFRLTLDFPRDVLAALGQGAADTITTDADSAIDTHRVAVLDVAYLLHWRNRNAASETISVDENVVAELCLYRVRVETFDASRAFISEFQLALALREYAPVEIILNASGVQDTNVSFALLLLGEWWEDLPAITICNPPKGLSVDKGIVVSREDATGVLRSMLLCQ